MTPVSCVQQHQPHLDSLDSRARAEARVKAWMDGVGGLSASSEPTPSFIHAAAAAGGVWGCVSGFDNAVSAVSAGNAGLIFAVNAATTAAARRGGN